MILSELVYVMGEDGLEALLSSGLTLDTPLYKMQTDATRHSLYVLQQDGTSWVLRIEPDDAISPGVDHHREKAIIERIKHLNCAPVVKVNRPDLGVLLMQHAGCVLGEHQIDTANVLAAVSQIHSIVDVPPIDYSKLFEQYRTALVGEGLRQLIDETERMLASLPDIDQCLVHHDLHTGNLCWHHQSLTIIDWEYAGLGIPWLDYAVLARDLNADRASLRSFTRLACLSDADFDQGIATAVGIVDQLEAIWQHYQDLKCIS